MEQQQNTSTTYEVIKSANDFLEAEDTKFVFSKTKGFAYGLQILKGVFELLEFDDFNKPFRITLDYNPEQLNVAIKKCFPKK